jgi:hypothetical protein
MNEQVKEKRGTDIRSYRLIRWAVLNEVKNFLIIGGHREAVHSLIREFNFSDPGEHILRNKVEV